MNDKARSFPDVPAVARSLAPSYPVYCVRPDVLVESAKRFISLFPGTVLYAVKCNPHPLILDALYKGGIRHFDTASLPEIAQICDTYKDAKAYFMHPVKGRAVIKSAYRVYGIRAYVVDHMSELEKVFQETGGEGLEIVARIFTPPSKGTLYHLAEKFGAPPAEAAEILREAAKRGAKVGVAFHVGSQCSDPRAYREAMHLVGETLEMAGVAPICVDVGGGFPATYRGDQLPPLEDYMAEIRAGVKDIKLKPTVELMAEPGRVLVAGGCSLLTQVQLRKGDRLYINDGIYGSLSEAVQAGIKQDARLIRLDEHCSEELKGFWLNGPSCDSLDVLPETYALPIDAREGDWIEIDQVGAYSNALSTHFNGFFPETYVKVSDPPPAAAQ